MAILRRCALAALILGAGACDFLREPTPPERLVWPASVHAMLRAGTDTVAVVVARSGHPDGGHGWIWDGRPVSGATVRLSGPAGEIELVEAAPGFRPCMRHPAWTSGDSVAGPGCYVRRYPEPIRGGGRYTLSVRLADGSEATGVAVVPERPTLLEPGVGARISVGAPGDSMGTVPLAVRWEYGAGGVLARWSLEPLAAFAGGARVDVGRCKIFAADEYDVFGSTTYADTVTLGIRYAACNHAQFDWDSIHARLGVWTYDTAYARYREAVVRSELVEAGEASAGIVGLPGLFAGVAATERRLVLVRQR